MKNLSDIDKIGFILDQLERRLAAVEANLRTVNSAISQLSKTTDVHTQSLKNVTKRITHENLSILDIIGDIWAKLDPIYDKVVPSFPEFRDELRRVFRRR